MPRLTELNLYQLLRRKQPTLSAIKSGYIFVSAEQFKNEEKAEKIYQAFQYVTGPTLIIECSSHYDESETNFWTTIDSFREKSRIIFISVTQVAQSLQDKLKYARQK